MKLALFSILCMLMATARTQRKSYTATKDADSSVHRLHCSVSSFLTPYRPQTILDPRPRADWPVLCLRFEYLTLCSVISLLTEDVLCPLFRSGRFWQAQLFVRCLHQNRQRKVFSTFRFKDARYKIPSLATHPRTHTETYTYTPIYIYIYISFLTD